MGFFVHGISAILLNVNAWHLFLSLLLSIKSLFSIFCRAECEHSPRNCFSVKLSAEMESKTVENRKIVRRAFCSLVKLQTVKRGKVLCVKLSARNEKQNSQAPKTCRKSLFAKPLCLALT
jgi:menaquinone-dependent protoporphyrinogen IX oxidase